MVDAQDNSSTLLTAEEREGLKPSWVTTRGDLNEVEQENIARASVWAYRTLRGHDLASDDFIVHLHKRMLGDVWQWAGTYRLSDKNIGIPHPEVPVAVRMLSGDAKVWIEEKVFPPQELAVRFHHRLVFIHPFPDGNGRHARFIADLLVKKLGAAPLTWGGGADLRAHGAMRDRYRAALQKADTQYDYTDLVAFCTS